MMSEEKRKAIASKIAKLRYGAAEKRLLAPVTSELATAIADLVEEFFAPDSPPAEPEKTRGQIVAEEFIYRGDGYVSMSKNKITSMIDSERAAMREECAKVADNEATNYRCQHHANIAKLIRAIK